MDKEKLFKSLYQEFEKKTQEEQIEFCKKVKDGWNDGIKDIYEEVLRVFYTEIATKCAPEDLTEWRKALEKFKGFEQSIMFFKNKYDVFISEDDNNKLNEI